MRGRTEHHRRARGEPPERVRPGVRITQVGLDLGELDGDPVRRQTGAEQPRGDLQGRRREQCCESSQNSRIPVALA
jgi:hypothetical protein